MTEPGVRQRPAQRPPEISKAEAAAIIALYLAAGDEEESPLISEALLRSLDAGLIAAAGAEELAEMALALTAWAFRGFTATYSPDVGTAETPGTADPVFTVLSGAELGREATIRGLYLGNALDRMAEDVRRGKSPEQARLKESTYFELHLQAGRRRTAAAGVVGAMRGLYGDVLGWYDMGDNRVRALHVRLGRENFRVGEPHVTEGYPGSKPNCRCVPGPPHTNGVLMSSRGLEDNRDSTRGGRITLPV